MRMPDEDSFKIRRARPDDAEAIATVHVESWRAAYRGHIPDRILNELKIGERTNDWKTWLDLPDLSAFLAIKTSSVCGFCTLTLSVDEDARQAVAEIPAFYVHPAWWRQGLGRELCKRAFEEARRRNFEAVTLWVLDSNQPARCFYESMGFSFDGNTKNDTGLTGTPLQEVRYRYSLPRAAT